MGFWKRILDYRRGGPQAIDGWPTQIPAREFQAVLAGALDPVLVPEDFERVADRRWVRSSRQPIRDLVEMEALKGTSYCPMWGFSLDFVPHVTGGGRIKWHRTPKSARFDLVYRPIDFASGDEAREWDTSPLATQEELADDVSRVAALVRANALPFLNAVQRVGDLPSFYREHRARPALGLPFGAFPQQFLAHAFVLARFGDPTASEILDEYLHLTDADSDVANELKRLLEKAA
jgi:hypothetical protein